jgi:hypothetical protein
VLGFRRGSGEIVARCRAPAMFWRSLVYGDDTTALSVARRTREHGRRSRLCPAEGEKGGWRAAGADELRLVISGIDLLRIRRGKGVWEERRVEGRRLGEGGGALAH